MPSCAAEASTRWRASGSGSTRQRSRSSTPCWRSPRELGRAGTYLSNYQAVIFRELGDLDAARAANEAALEAARDLSFAMPRRFALSDLLQTALLDGDIGRAQADWPAPLGGRHRGNRLDALADPRPAGGRAVGDRRSTPTRPTWPPSGRRKRWTSPCAPAGGSTRSSPARTWAARSWRWAARPTVSASSARRSRSPTRSSTRSGAGTHAQRSRTSLRTTGDEADAAATTSEARRILTDFAATLAPSRAETLLASPPARAILETSSQRRQERARDPLGGVPVAVERRRVGREARVPGPPRRSRPGRRRRARWRPTSTVSTHSVDGRIVTHGTRYQYASFWSPPESVATTRACDAADANAR